MAAKKPRATKPKPAPPAPPKTWWERATTRVSEMDYREWAGVSVVCGIVVLLIVLTR